MSVARCADTGYQNGKARSRRRRIEARPRRRIDPRFADGGNAGQLDLILALKWVRDDIAAFGGDPGWMMGFGQSGGGARIATMIGMPAASGLFHRAATMSGRQVTASGPLNATARARAYLAGLKVTEADLSPLLAMPVARLVERLAAVDPVPGGGVYFGPVLDMTWLDRHPFWPDANPPGNGIPMMLGDTHDETRGFIPPDAARVRGLDGDNLAAPDGAGTADRHPARMGGGAVSRALSGLSPLDVFYGATTAGRRWRGRVIEAEARAAAGAAAWMYQLDYRSRRDPARGAFHTMDIPLAFGRPDAAGSETGAGAVARVPYIQPGT